MPQTIQLLRQFDVISIVNLEYGIAFAESVNEGERLAHP
jgi:hypothetical protein